MWKCYTILKENGFKHLSLFTEDLQEIYDFISALTKIDSDGYMFTIEKEDEKSSLKLYT